VKERDDRAEFRGCEGTARTSLRTDEGACQSNGAMPPYCRVPKHQENALAPLEEEQGATCCFGNLDRLSRNMSV
jgi:hypothetical protein